MPGNALITPDVIAREALFHLERNLVVSNLVYRDHDQEFTGAKVGDTVTIRKPPEYEVTNFGRHSRSGTYNASPYGTFPLAESAADGIQTLREDGATGVGATPSGGAAYSPTIYIQDVSEGGVPMVLDNHFDISVGLSSRELSLEFDRFSEDVVEPAMIAMAERIDTLVYAQAKYIPYISNLDSSNDPAAISGLTNLANLDADLLTQKVPLRGRSALVNPATKASLMVLDAFHRADARGDEGTALREASMGRIMGLDWYGVQGVSSFTNAGMTNVTATVDGDQSAGAATLDVANAGAAAWTLVTGDVIVVDGNQYMVTAGAVVADTAGTATLSIYPRLVADVTDTTVIDTASSHTMNIAGNMRGISLAMVPLEAPMDNNNSAIMSSRGLSVRVVYGYDINTKSNVLSFDLLAGCRVVHPEMLRRFAI